MRKKSASDVISKCTYFPFVWLGSGLGRKSALDVLQNALLFLVQKSCSSASLAFCNLLFGAIHSHEKEANSLWFPFL